MYPSLLSRAVFITGNFCRKTSTSVLHKLNYNKTFITPVRSMTNYTSKFESPEFKKLFTNEFDTLVQLFSKNGHELRIAGGAVRDLLTGKLPHDVDFATTATPQEMIEMFEKEKVRMINNNGEKHGTVTCRINDRENFEVTTLRIDLVTDGRRAEVMYTKDWEKDAERRDLTVNSMFLGLDGTLYDYFDGRKDLAERRLRFVGDASKRIQEDYLRILRYFRFYGRISSEPDNHEEETLEAIKNNAGGLNGISGERLWVELKKIATGNHAPHILKVMADTDVLSHLGFTGELHFDVLHDVWQKCHDLQPLPMTVMSALFDSKEQVQNLHRRVKMSNDEFLLGELILDHRRDEALTSVAKETSPSDKYDSDGDSHEAKKPRLDSGESSLTMGGLKEVEPINSEASLRHCQDLMMDFANMKKPQEKIVELLKYLNLRETLADFQKWTPPKFPVNGVRLIEMGVPRGPLFSVELNKLKVIWRESRYTKTEEELLQHLKSYEKAKS